MPPPFDVVDLLLLGYALALTYLTAASIYVFLGFPRLPEASPTSTPFVSFILPVRNQESTAASCVASLLAQEYPGFEVIVVDGHSTDGTLEALEPYGERIKLIEEPPLPPGWVGKVWACHVGYREARGDLLLFTDGDTFHHPSLLKRAVAYMQEENIDLLTLSPNLRTESFWERALLPFFIFLIGLMHRGNWINRPEKRWAIANGQFMLFRRDAYERVGGHQAVRGRVDEDYRLALLVKGMGFRLRMVDARDAFEVRMYRSLREIWNGFVKSAFPGLDFSLGRTIRSVAGLGLILVIPFIVFTAALMDAVFSAPDLTLLTAAYMAALVWGRVCLAHGLINGRPLYALLTPLLALMVSAILLDSARRYLRQGGVFWKGRFYGPPLPEDAAHFASASSGGDSHQP